jgi:hypothetical protein
LSDLKCYGSTPQVLEIIFGMQVKRSDEKKQEEK